MFKLFLSLIQISNSKSLSLWMPLMGLSTVFTSLKFILICLIFSYNSTKLFFVLIASIKPAIAKIYTLVLLRFNSRQANFFCAAMDLSILMKSSLLMLLFPAKLSFSLVNFALLKNSVSRFALSAVSPDII